MADIARKVDRPIHSGAQLLCSLLVEQGVDTIFGYPGAATLPVYDALLQYPVRHVMMRHEQGAIHAAQGYARVTGRPGVVLTTSGPGATNLITGITDAFMDSTPLVILTGQVDRKKIGSDAFQEADTFGITMPITKHNYQIRDVRDLPQAIADAFHIAATGRPGPVAVDLPKDVLAEAAEEQALPLPDPRGYTLPSAPDDEAIEQIVAAIGFAKRPLMLVGGGVISANAADLVRRFTHRANIPVVSTLMGLGAVATDDDLFIGMLGMHGTFAANRAVTECDLLLALGVRFSDRVTGKPGRFAPNSLKVHVDIDRSEIGKNVKIDIPLQADVAETLEAMLTRVSEPEIAAWHEQIMAWKQKWATPPERSSALQPWEIIGMLAKESANETIVVTDVGQHQIWAARFYPHTRPRHFLTSGGLGTMGYGLPAAIGAQFARPDATVLLVTGDGSVQMCLRELQTIAEHGLPIKIAIMNNGYLGMVRQWQQFFHERRYAESRISSPDFAKLGEAYGLLGLQATTHDEAQNVIREALQHQGPVVMNFIVHEEGNVFPMVPAGKDYDEMILENS